MTIEFVSGSTTDIKITNLWDGGKTINAKYDSKTGKVSIPTKQVIFVHADYGDVWMEDVNGSQNISGLFTPKGGFLNINAFSAICGAGTFVDRYVKSQIINRLIFIQTKRNQIYLVKSSI